MFYVYPPELYKLCLPLTGGCTAYFLIYCTVYLGEEVVLHIRVSSSIVLCTWERGWYCIYPLLLCTWERGWYCIYPLAHWSQLRPDIPEQINSLYYRPNQNNVPDTANITLWESAEIQVIDTKSRMAQWHFFGQFLHVLLFDLETESNDGR